ncbi:MAG: DEAD/DEAH box helicase [Mariprofundales bacterium]|nr:DEAD/DEAH box helicase [Mariprofundales bacterium]
MQTFEQIALSAPLQRAVADQGYTTPTPVQAQAIPLVLAGHDVMAAAQTGTGKTAAFTLPMLHHMMQEHVERSHPRRVRALVLTPTRELAAQVEESVRTYGKYLPLTSTVIFGGVGLNPQITKLKRGVDIVIACPGRLLDLINRGAIEFSGLEFLVLDEADRMLDMGFIRDIRKILTRLPKQRQNLMFSATFSNDIKKLASGIMNQPKLVEVARNQTVAKIVQRVYPVGKSNKRALLSKLIKEGEWPQVLVFMRTKHGANRLTTQLDHDGISAVAIHGNKSQNARTKALADFKQGKVSVLVATDIAARGLDIDQLPHVVNYELPNVPEDYVHRIGRTGRAGRDGLAVSLVCHEEEPLLRDIEKLIREQIARVTVEGFGDAAAGGGVPRDREPNHPRPQRNRGQQHQRRRRPAGR